MLDYKGVIKLMTGSTKISNLMRVREEVNIIKNILYKVARPRHGVIGPLRALEINYLDRKSTRLNSSHSGESRMPSSA